MYTRRFTFKKNVHKEITSVIQTRTSTSVMDVVKLFVRKNGRNLNKNLNHAVLGNTCKSFGILGVKNYMCHRSCMPKKLLPGLIIPAIFPVPQLDFSPMGCWQHIRLIWMNSQRSDLVIMCLERFDHLPWIIAVHIDASITTTGQNPFFYGNKFNTQNCRGSE